MDACKSRFAPLLTRLASVAALLLALSSPSLAQNAPSPAGEAAPPPREGNVYGHYDHQPARKEVDSAETAVGMRPPSSESTSNVEKEVKQLLEQTDELDREVEERSRSER
jgi:hypothetical protein